MKDWIGNNNSVYTTLGASSHSKGEREVNDYYATAPDSLIPLLPYLDKDIMIWESACGEGHLSQRLIDEGFSVYSTDLIDRGFGIGGVDFLTYDKPFDGIILTNPPYKYAQEFVEKALDLVQPGKEVIMFLKIQFLEGQKRRSLFERGELREVLIFSKRQKCAKNGDFGVTGSSAVAYARFIWEKGFNGNPIIKWI